MLTSSCCNAFGVQHSRQLVSSRFPHPLRCHWTHGIFQLCRGPDQHGRFRNQPESAAAAVKASGRSHQCAPEFLQSVSVLVAGSVIVNAVATPLVLPAAAAIAPRPADTASVKHTREPLYAVANAPSVHSDSVEVPEQQQWWQQDQQVWLELTSAAELTAYLSSNQTPPAWPALDSTALNPKLRLVEFYATWCPACKAAAPGMAEVAGDLSLRQHCSFARVNIDRVKPLVRQLGITKIPTVLLLGPDGATLASFRASGQAARDALQQQLVAWQQQQQQQQPLLPPSLPPGAAEGGEQAEGQPPASEVDDNRASSSSEGAGGSVAATHGAQSSSTGSNGSNGSNSNDSSPSAAACGVVPDPSCGVALPDTAAGNSNGSASSSSSNSSSSPSSLQAASSTGPVASPGSSSQQAPPADAALQAAKQQFLQQNGAAYGYGGWLDQHYQQEIGDRLGPDKHYLDYTGAALYPASLLEAVYKDLISHTYGNPHSAAAASVAPSSTGSGSSTGASADAVAAVAPPAAASEVVMEAAAAAVLEHLHADPADYQVVFTRSATEALRMVGEMFPWSSSSSSSGSGSSSSSFYQQPSVPSGLDMLTRDSMQAQPQLQGFDEAAAQLAPTDDNSSSSSSHVRPRSKFIYTRSNHNSVLGVGAYAAAAGAELSAQSDPDMEAWVATLERQQQQQQSESSDTAVGSAVQTPTYNLLAYPAQDNFAGVVYPLDWINRVHAASSPQGRTLVLLDAAAYLPTHELDLSQHPADFVVASFYKMFGYPTGLGVLVLRTEHVPALNKVYFGGGSVALATPEGCWHVGKCDPAAALSDGTPNYLGAAALNLAFEAWDSRGGMQAVDQHTQSLSTWLSKEISSLHHSNGAPLLQLYSSHNRQQGPGFSQGAVFNFQVLQPDGQPISFSRVDREATAAGLYLRSGCVCNPGACYDAVGLEASEVQALAGLKEGCGDEMDFATVMRPALKPDPTAACRTGKSSWWLWNVSGSQQQQQRGEKGVAREQGAVDGALVPTQVPLGSIRVSLGWASTFEDVYALVQFLRGYLS